MAARRVVEMLMRTVDTIRIHAPLARVFGAAAGVERWPEFLPHYRWVRFLERRDDGGRVAMSAWRRFGPFPWPTWWVSEMSVHPDEPAVRYRHVGGITKGMDVVWRFREEDGGVEVEIVHEWPGPRWPLIGGPAANLVIGPVFIHHIASRTLAGVKRLAESG
jgi:ribosome-associated toxin RatA of RatAB toxin-antitoxin module